MAAPVVLRVEHVRLANGLVSFTDDEVVRVDVRREQIVVEQGSQSGNLSMVYAGEERYEFDLLFNIFFQDTLEKLEAVRAIRETFDLLPFILEEPATRFEVFWPQEPTLREQWVRGRRQAQWDLPLVWKESRIVPCVPVTIPS